MNHYIFQKIRLLTLLYLFLASSIFCPIKYIHADNLFENDDLFNVNPEWGFYNEESHGIYFDGAFGVPGWEAVDPYKGMFAMFMLMNNSFGLTYFIPDEPWLDQDLRKVLKDHMDGRPEMFLDADH